MVFGQNSSEFEMSFLEMLAGNMNGKVLGHYGEERDYIKGDKGLVVV